MSTQGALKSRDDSNVDLIQGLLLDRYCSLHSSALPRIYCRYPRINPHSCRRACDPMVPQISITHGSRQLSNIHAVALQETIVKVAHMAPAAQSTASDHDLGEVDGSFNQFWIVRSEAFQIVQQISHSPQEPTMARWSGAEKAVNILWAGATVGDMPRIGWIRTDQPGRNWDFLHCLVCFLPGIPCSWPDSSSRLLPVPHQVAWRVMC